MLGGQIDYSGLPVVAEILGINDIEWLVNMLILIRETK
jgi:hypothetical protein